MAIKQTSLFLLAITLTVLLQSGGRGQTLQAKLDENQSLPRAKVYHFTSGLWFNGKEFKKETFYSLNGILTAKKPAKIDETINLGGGYVIPPFGEAHNHSLEGDFNFDQINANYLNAGIFYYKNPNSLRRVSEKIASKLNKPHTLDAVFAGGGLTATGGHPTWLYDKISNNSRYKFLNLPNLENEAYFIINNQADLDAKWEKILAGRPDFIKTYLLYSEEFAARRDNPNFYVERGLDPEILPFIVERAHRAGLQVTTHVETATDFHNALVAGVDEISHLPGYYISALRKVPQFVISEADARLAAEQKTTIVTTIAVTENFYKSQQYVKMTAEAYKAIKANQARNLALLKKYRVKLAVGADRADLTALDEAMYLRDLKVFTNLELLKMWTETTAQTIFPRRKIGYLKADYEASFLVLEDNPLTDFEAVKRIKMRFKQGYMFPPIAEIKQK